MLQALDITSHCNWRMMVSMNQQPDNEPVKPKSLIDSLNHPLAGPIRKLLTAMGGANSARS
jgi:uncharacterized protein YggT (Ycf19 family)